MSDYIVVRGDNLWDIAKTHGVGFQELKDANPELAKRIPPYGVNPGDKIDIPSPNAPQQTSPNTTTQLPPRNVPASSKAPCPAFVMLIITEPGMTNPIARMTLKHDKDCDLHILVLPANTSARSPKIEIRTSGSTAWCELPNINNLVTSTYSMNIAGNFFLRAKVTCAGGEQTSAEVPLEVQFPSFAEISSDSVVTAATNASWARTLNDVTLVPNLRRERAFWISLDTGQDAYIIQPEIAGRLVGPAQGASVNPGAQPPDTPGTPSPCDSSAVYTVAIFHTHTSTVNRPGNGRRRVGPSTTDQTVITSWNMVGLVYDYVENPVGSGRIPMGHPLNDPAMVYFTGVNRRPTP